MSKKYHPDTSENPEETRDLYVRIQKAYEILRDSEKREQYDKSGDEDLGKDNQQQQQYEQWRLSHLFDDDDNVENLSNDRMFEELLYGKEGVLVFFWSRNFPSCVGASKEYRQFAKQYKGVLRITHVNCDWTGICNRLGGIGMPALGWVRDSSLHWFVQHWHLPHLAEFAVNLLQNQVPKKFHQYPALEPSAFPIKHCYQLLTFEMYPCDECLVDLIGAVVRFKGVTQPRLAHVKSPGVRIARLDCEEYPTFCEQHNVTATVDQPWRIGAACPTGQQSSANPDVGAGAVQFVPMESDYASDIAWMEGPMSMGNLLLFLTQQTATHGVRFSSFKQFREEVKESNDGWVIAYFAGKGEPVDVADVEVVARILQGHASAKSGYPLRVGQVHCDEVPQACQGLDVPDDEVMYTVWMYTQAAKTNPWVYQESMLPVDIAEKVKVEAEPVFMNIITADNSHKLLNGNWLILYSAGAWCPPCTQIKDPFKDAARLLEGDSRLQVAMVDCDTYKPVCTDAGIGGYPTVVAAVTVKGRRMFHNFDGQRSGHGIAHWAIESLNNNVLNFGNQLPQVTSDPNRLLVVMFGAGQWCPPCMRAKQFWPEVAERLADKYEVGMVNCDSSRHLCYQFGIRGYPTFFVYSRNKRGERVVHQFEDDHSADNIVRFAKKYLP